MKATVCAVVLACVASAAAAQTNEEATRLLRDGPNEPVVRVPWSLPREVASVRRDLARARFEHLGWSVAPSRKRHELSIFRWLFNLHSPEYLRYHC